MKKLILALALFTTATAAFAGDAVSFKVCKTGMNAEPYALIEDFGDSFAVYSVSRLNSGVVMAEFPVVKMKVEDKSVPNTLIGYDTQMNSTYTIARDSGNYWIDYPDQQVTWSYSDCADAPAQLAEMVRTSMNAAARPQ